MKTKIAIISLVIAELVTVGFLARALFHNYVWKYEACRHAQNAGGLEAKADYRKGYRRVLEPKVIDTTAENYSGPAYDSYQLLSTGRKKDGLEVWQVVQSPELSKPHAIALSNYVYGYNFAMHVRSEHPEWFTLEGDRIPRKK